MNAGLALSEQEENVLRKLAMGYTNREVADQLGISIEIVQTCKSSGMNKLSLDTRGDLVRHAVAHKWLNDS